jgi:2-polyprenyl-3-methyl-5-hydroxy-6-metoxy-1,4-benzoquinol methylase
VANLVTVSSKISSVLRRLRLLKVAEWIRFKWQELRYYSANKRFRKENPDLVLPPDYFIYETYRLNVSDYYNDGKTTAGEIVHNIRKVINIDVAGSRILDWGCGPARITRHLPGLLPGATVIGADYNSTYIQWCRQHLKNIRFIENRIDPPIDLESGSLDAVIGISIFTHLSQKNHSAWIDELYRLLKPGGAVFITTQGAGFLPIMLEAEQKRFHKGMLVIREDIREGNRLFSAFQPPAFVQELIKNRFEVVDHSAGDKEAQQDSWLLKKS